MAGPVQGVDTVETLGAGAPRGNGKAQNPKPQTNRGGAAMPKGTGSESEGHESHDELPSFSSLREQAAHAADEARSTAGAIAQELRQRMIDAVDHQKAAGADSLSDVAGAAKAAADRLKQDRPQLARYVRSAADGVDRLAEDLRSRDLEDIASGLSDLGRRQPVAFFAGAVLAGFVLARFLKSDVPAAPTPARLGPSGRA